MLLAATSVPAQRRHHVPRRTHVADTLKQQKEDVWKAFLNGDEYPDGTRYLPPPPDSLSQAFITDIIRYHEGKTMRHGERAAQAVREAGLSVREIMSDVSTAFGCQLTPEALPELGKLISCVTTDACGSTSKAKRYYQRKRPFLYFREPTLIPEEEASHHTPSYPSSHSATGWALALVLAELNPGQQEALLQWGYEFGQSRVIAGYHYQSDVDAARLAASAVVARLHANEAFQRQLNKAKREILPLLGSGK